MLRTKLLYFAVFIASVVFFILYTEPFSLYLLIITASLPVILAAGVILAKIMTKVTIEMDYDTAIKNEKINVCVNISNRMPVPFTNCVVILEYINNLIGIEDYMSVSVPVHSLCSEQIKFSVISDHCGILDIKVESVRIYDFIELFSCRIKPDKTCSIAVLPELYPISSAGNFNMINSEDSDYFSKHKSGDDPSEIFELKDYVPGDKPNRIHWNLSLKQDELIVRHYSQPISTSILLILDFSGKPGHDADVLDTAAEAAFSIAFFFAENDIPINIAYYSPAGGGIEIERVSDEKDAALVIKRILSEGPLLNTYFSGSMKDFIYNYSSVFYISASVNNMAEIVKEYYSENLRPVFIERENSSSHEFSQNNEVTVIPAGKASQFMSDLLIRN